MFYHTLKFTGVALVSVLAVGACSSSEIKQKNIELEQQNESSMQALSDAQVEMAAMRDDLNKALIENQLIAKKVDELTVIDMEYNILFSPGQIELSREGKALVRKIAESFNKYAGYHMRIEGHTDSLPINAKLKQRYYSNWELSAARAAVVARYMIYALNVPGENLSIAGFADKKPVASNATVEGRAQNRRIRAVVYKF